MIPILTPDESAAWDARAARAGVELATLMESAGRAATVVLADRFGHLLRRGVLVATGPGNNGGDGWVIARALHRLGVPVWVVAAPGEAGTLCRQMAVLAGVDGIRDLPPDGPWPTVGLVVDALLGTGAKGPPRAPMAELLARLLDLELPIVAIDGPTGVDLLSGTVYGTPKADLTITFGGLRRGHLLARDEVGDVVVVDIGHPSPDPAWPTIVTDAKAAGWFRYLSARDHKGDHGRVVIVGGAAGMTGAIRMAARAAFGAGAGLVHAVAPPATVAALIEAEPDVQTLAQEFDGPPSTEFLALVERADAVVIGPGLGRAPGRAALVAALLERAQAAVLDADALVAFHGATAELGRLITERPVVLTPHAGEFRGLFPSLASTREIDPWSAAAAAATEIGAAVLLKGVPTVIATPGRPLLTVAAGNPGLATGGSGDVLSGLIGAALGHRIDPLVAAALGAQALGRAADFAVRRTAARTLRPTDVIAALPDLWREWDILRRVRPTVRPPILLDLPRPAAV